MSARVQRLRAVAPWLALALVACWFLGQAHVRVADELSRMLDESWAGGPVNPALVDPVSENLTFAAARRFHARGLSEKSYLPCYEGYVSASPISGFLELEDDCVYTHFLPGPEYVLAALFAVFGDSDEALMRMRLLPLLLVLAAALALALAVCRYALGGWPWGAPLLLAGLLATPALSFWSLSLYGHGYSNACILAALALGLVASEPRAAGRGRWVLVSAAFLLGWLSNLFLLEAAFVVCAAPLVGHLLARESGSRRLALQLSAAVAAGLCLVWLVHLAQVAHHLGSLSLALEDQLGTALLRTETRAALAVGSQQGDGLGPGLGVSGSGRAGMLCALSAAGGPMFGVGALSMLASGLFAAWLQRSRGPGRRLAQALLLAAIAAIVFPMLFGQHAVLHLDRLPRIFLGLFSVWLVVWLSLAEERLRAGLHMAGEAGADEP